MISAKKEHPFMLEIEGFEHTIEVLHSRFDNAIDLLPEKAVIYGGAIRDILAKMPLKADLDILCHTSLYSKVLKRQFLDDPCWFLINEGDKSTSSSVLYGLTMVEEAKTVLDKIHELPTVTAVSRSTKPSHSADNLSKYLEQIVSFGNADGVVAQVMVVKQNTQDDFMDLPLALAKQVDLICCGLVMTKDGRIYEVVPDARKDCINRVLRLNPNSQIISAERTTKRIEKLVGRGWISAITDKELAEAEKRAESQPTSEVKSPTFRLDSIDEPMMIRSRPYRPAEKKRLYSSERIDAAYKSPFEGMIAVDKARHTELDALERRVISRYNRDGLSVDSEAAYPIIEAKTHLESFATKAYPTLKLRHKTLHEKRELSREQLTPTKRKPTEPGQLSSYKRAVEDDAEYAYFSQTYNPDQVVKVSNRAMDAPNYFEQYHYAEPIGPPDPIIEEFGKPEKSYDPKPIVEELGVKLPAKKNVLSNYVVDELEDIEDDFPEYEDIN